MSARELASDPDNTGSVDDILQGERGRSAVSRNRSLQSRVSSVMACALMLAVGVGMLFWYYTAAFTAPSRARRLAQSASLSRAQSEMSLPALGPIAAFPDPTAGGSPEVREPPVSAHTEFTQPPVIQAGPPAVPSNPGASGVYAARPKSAAELAVERKLSGAAFARTAGVAGVAGVAGGAASGREESGLGELLKPTVLNPVRAQMLVDQRFLLPKGAFIDCTLETAIDSTLPGMTTCVTATDTFGMDGSVVLLERGTKLVGETRGQVQQGAARVFVLWSEARTPRGVVVPLDSPGADELGRSGLPGEVDRHFWARFGAAILISTLDGAVQAAVQSAGGGGGTLIYNPSTSESVVTDVLKNSVNIPPTVTKRNGDRIQILVARDVDFRTVYQLRTADGGR